MGETNADPRRAEKGASRYAHHEASLYRQASRCTLAAIATLALLITGCTSKQRVLSDQAQARELPEAVELDQTPFFPQSDYQCGPAALATVLSYSGVAVTPDALVDRVYIPDRQGSLQAEIAAAARREGRLAYVLEPQLGALMAELSAGRPVLVLQELGWGPARTWHYAVVMGYSTASGRLILRSGTTRREQLSVSQFLRSWRGGGNWAMVVIEPGQLPAEADEDRYLRAAAAMELAGQPQATVAAFAAAVAAWPGSAGANFGLGNAYYRQGDYMAAARLYLAALKVEPDNPAMLNNLAQAQMASGQCAPARKTLARARAAADADFEDAIRDSQADFAALCDAR